MTAMVYRHSDGYPDGSSGIVADLVRFVAWLTGEPEPRPLHDLEYLAANWIYWNKSRLARIRDGAEKLGVGICPSDPGHLHGDVEFLYVFDGENLKISERLGFGNRPGSWDSAPWQFEGTLAEAYRLFVGAGSLRGGIVDVQSAP
jgi:hypothetical protein